MTQPAPYSAEDVRWRTAGERIQTLLDASAAGGAAARERAEQLVREVTDLYGAALARMLDISRGIGPHLADRFAEDDLVASLLLVHGLHPHSTARRIARGLDTVRPYLGSHGGDVTLVDVVDGPDGVVVRLQFQGSCHSCPSSSVTLELAVEDALRAAAPEISAIEVIAAQRDDAAGTVISAESLLNRIHTIDRVATVWQAVPEFARLRDGEVGGFRLGTTTALVCRVGDDVFAYRDRCPCCHGTLAGARLAAPVLWCPGCGAGFDVVHAGRGVGDDAHLQPLPVLERDGVLSMALAEPSGMA